MSSNSTQNLSQTTLLVADPDPETRQIISNLLEGRVKRFYAVANGQEALLAFSRFAPDVTLCEAQLPDMDGLELSRNILELEPEAMVLLLARPGDLPSLQAAFAAGITRHAAKPVEPERLLPLLERCAGRVLRLKGLEAEHRRNALLLESLPAPSMLLAQDTASVLTANPAARELGFTPGAVCSGEFFPQDVLRAFFPTGDRTQRMMLPRTDAMQLDIQARERFWEVTYAPIAANTLLFSALDVTQRVRAQQELKQSSLFLDQIINTAQAPLSVKDKELRFVTVNNAFCTLLGLPRKEILGKRIDELIAPAEAEGILLEERRVFSSGANTSEHSITDAQGQEHVLVVLRAVFSHPATGEPVMVSALSDVTAQREMESLREDVERITRHDLKSPLSAVISLPQLIMEEGSLSETQEQFLQMIHDSGQRILEMVNRSLDIYKMERGAYQLQAGAVNLRQVARRVVQDLKHLAQKSLVEVVLDTDQENEPAAWNARGEEMLCYSLLANLMRNAIEATPQGGRVTAQFSRHSSHCFATIHNPLPVPREVEDKFFQKYATFGKQKGTGLGTYSARLMAETMHGSLTMQTDDQKGTTVTLSLPLWE